MIKVGNILINPDDISSIHKDFSTLSTQIIYKNGVVKNFKESEIGMSYDDFIESFIKIKEKEETDKLFRIMTALKSIQNG